MCASRCRCAAVVQNREASGETTRGGCRAEEAADARSPSSWAGDVALEWRMERSVCEDAQGGYENAEGKLGQGNVGLAFSVSRNREDHSRRPMEAPSLAPSLLLAAPLATCKLKSTEAWTDSGDLVRASLLASSSVEGVTA